MKSEGKQKFAHELALMVANELCEILRPFCGPDRLVVAGSLRRGKPEVGDIEILYVPAIGSRMLPGELFGTPVNVVDATLDEMLRRKALIQRLNVEGRKTWGGRIKLAAHAETGIPIDFFEATNANWFNYLVCRTGPKESNIQICKAARERGLEWHPYSPGFRTAAAPYQYFPMHSEQEVFEFVGLKHVQPGER